MVEMASPHPPTPSTASSSHRSPWDFIKVLLAHGASTEGILTVAKLEEASLDKLLDIHQDEGRGAVGELVDSLKTIPEKELRSLIDIVVKNKERSEGGRSPSLNPTRPAIDNDARHATTATPFATPLATTHLLAPPVPLMPYPRSISTGTPSVSSRGSSSTNRSNKNRVTKRVSAPRGVVPTDSKRKIYSCPACASRMKNSFSKHFEDHVKHELRDDIGIHDSIGCGYCTSYDLVGGHGKVYHGKDDLIKHVKDNHTNTPDHRLHWEFNASFNHTLIAQEIFRRNLVDKIGQEFQNSAPPNKLLVLSWARSPITEQLLRELQVVSGEIDNCQPSCSGARLHDLIERVYSTASQSWQDASILGNTPQPTAPRLVTPRIYPQQASSSPQDIAGMGQVSFDGPTPNYPHSIASPSIISPSTPAPAHRHQLAYRHQQPPTINIGPQNNASAHVASTAQHASSQNIAFDAFSLFATATSGSTATGSTPSSQLLPLDGSLEEVLKEWVINDSQL